MAKPVIPNTPIINTTANAGAPSAGAHLGAGHVPTPENRTQAAANKVIPGPAKSVNLLYSGRPKQMLQTQKTVDVIHSPLIAKFDDAESDANKGDRERARITTQREKALSKPVLLDSPNAQKSNEDFLSANCNVKNKNVHLHTAEELAKFRREASEYAMAENLKKDNANRFSYPASPALERCVKSLILSKAAGVISVFDSVIYVRKSQLTDTEFSRLTSLCKGTPLTIVCTLETTGVLPN